MQGMIFTIAVMILTAMPAFAQRAESDNYSAIIVSGNAQVQVSPDEAIVRIGVLRQAGNAQAAQDQTSMVANEIIAALTKIGIASTQIQTSRLTLNPVYAPRNADAGQPARIIAYQAANVVSVRLDDLSKIGPAIDAGLKAGANELQGVYFGLRDDLAAREQALKQAVTEARRKAEAIASSLNVTLLRVLEVSEGGVTILPRNDFGGAVMARAEAAPTPVSPGQIEVNAQVTVRYQITQKQ
jgi:uncharacterized protein YggE